MNHDMIQFVAATHRYRASGRLHSPRNMIGQVFRNADGREYVIFRQTLLDPVPGHEQRPEAMFRVQFRVSKIVPWRDRLVIALKSPIFVGLPGFRSKLWMVDKEHCTYQGVYEWDRLEDAEAYVYSASMGFMSRMAVPGSVSYEILPGAAIVRRGTSWSMAVS